MKKERGEAIEGSGKILVMDDEKIVREVAREILERLGYEVHLAENGNMAIEIFKQFEGAPKGFDAVILDLTVPGSLGGKETLRKLKEIDPEVKVIVSSGYSNEPAMYEYEKHGFSGAVPKPYKADYLADVLSKVLKS